MTIHLTDTAAQQISRQLEKRGKGLGLRLGVKKSGCTGYAYVIDFQDAEPSDESVFEDRGVRIYVPADSVDFLSGTTVDFRREGISEAFRFDNPNVKAECGCGESFAV
jgi:iron-sulfur cluster assembly protein